LQEWYRTIEPVEVWRKEIVRMREPTQNEPKKANGRNRPISYHKATRVDHVSKCDSSNKKRTPTEHNLA
jgi:hypothetical protein